MSTFDVSGEPTRAPGRESVRNRLLDAAQSALATTPARRLSVRDLARDIGVSHAAPYRHFGDLAGFRQALAARCLLSLVEAQRARISGVPDPRTRLLLAGLEYTQWATAHPHAFLLAFDPEVNVPGEASPELATAIEAHATLLGELVTEAAPEEAGTSDLAAALWSGVHGLADLVAAGRLPATSAGPAVERMLAMLGSV